VTSTPAFFIAETKDFCDGLRHTNQYSWGMPSMCRLLCGISLVLGVCACSSRLDLGGNDASVAYDADCKAGTYSGTYACTASADAGALTLALPTSGPLSVTLVTEGAPTTLTIGPDAALSSPIQGGAASAAIAGTLDCSTRKLTGTIAGPMFSSGTIVLNTEGVGPFSAVYDADASPPALVDGVMDPPVGAACTWTATLR
jgi:hypothetical protein